MNKSPWLDFDRKTFPALTGKKEFDICIVGGGIAGISTLYFLLKNTDKTVALLEKNFIGSGATGHNAGFIVNTIEKGTDDLLEDFGEEKTTQGFRELDNGWNLLEEMLETANCAHKLVTPEGDLGYNSLDQIINALDEEPVDEKIGRGNWKYLIAEEVVTKDMIPEKFHKNIEFVPHQQVLDALHIKDPVYICASMPDQSVIKRGIMNSALFCQEILDYLLTIYPDRFTIFEDSAVETINLNEKVTLKTPDGEIVANQIVLCTNGYTGFSVLDATGNTITKSKDWIIGTIEYMVGYFSKDEETFTTALFGDNKRYNTESYFYFYNSPFFKDSSKILRVLGGYDRKLGKDEQYNATESFPENAVNIFREFIKNTFEEEVTDFNFSWHGLMGYTQNGVRLIGPDPKYPQLFYNLGCNGIGLLSSIVGGEKISRLINGEASPPSFYDPN